VRVNASPGEALGFGLSRPSVAAHRFLESRAPAVYTSPPDPASATVKPLMEVGLKTLKAEALSSSCAGANIKCLPMASAQ
jgi:hypothetical protein